MGHRWKLDVPPPLYVETELEAYELLHLLLKKAELYPNEPLAYDTETHALKISIANRWDDKGNEIPDVKPSGRDPLDWMRDTITFWSLSARMDRETQPYWDAYLTKWHPNRPRMPYARWCLQSQHFYIFSPLFENENIIIATWNGKYDAHITANCHVNIWVAEVRDLLVAASLYDENLQGRLSLKERAEKWCGLHMTKYKDLFDVDAHGNKAKEFETSLFDLPIERVIDYASYDAYATLKCYEWLEDRLTCLEDVIDEEGQVVKQCSIINPDTNATLWDHFLNVEVPFTMVLWRMERRGMRISLPMLQEVEPKLRTEIAQLDNDINRETGRLLNINSPKQLVRYFFTDPPDAPLLKDRGKGYDVIKMTRKGGKTPSTDVSVMEALEAKGDQVASMILRCRKLRKLLSTYILSLKTMAMHHRDGRIHPSFNQYGAKTGRISATAPNSMNIPRPDNDEFNLRSMFTAPPRFKLIVGDYSQAEMRIMAHMSSDSQMLNAIRDGMDVHCFTVSLMNNVPYDEVIDAVAQKDADKSQMTDRQKYLVGLRQAAKIIGFGLMYGAGPPRVAGQLNISEDEAKDKIERYFAAFPKVRQYIKLTHERCRQYGYVETIAGRRRRLPDINSHNRELRAAAEREATNVVIQGSASDIIKEAMINIEFDPELNVLEAQLINQVHDEVVVEVPEDNADYALTIIKRHMEFPFNGQPALSIPLPVDLHKVDCWSDAK